MIVRHVKLFFCFFFGFVFGNSHEKCNLVFRLYGILSLQMMTNVKVGQRHVTGMPGVSTRRARINVTVKMDSQAMDLSAEVTGMMCLQYPWKQLI